MTQDKTQRLSVSLDEESADLVKNFQEKFDCSKAEVIRKSLKYLKIANKAENSLSQLNAYLDFLLKGEHVIVDKEHWRAFFEEIGEGSEKFWNQMKEVGKEHREGYRDKGMKDVEDILRYVEKTNWYSLNKDSDESFTLILRERASKKFVKKFLESLFDESPKDVELQDIRGKIRARILKDSD